jgi:outer membrane protein assembly factor BamD (BamD/ComL family)
MCNFLESRVYITEALYCLATAYYSMEKYDKARGYAEELLMQNPDNKQVGEIGKCLQLYSQ